MAGKFIWNKVTQMFLVSIAFGLALSGCSRGQSKAIKAFGWQAKSKHFRKEQVKF
jgi:hypothetical protein